MLLADEEAEAAVALLAQDGRVIGESGAAGVAGLLALAHDERGRGAARAAGLARRATVLAIGTEGHAAGTHSAASVHSAATSPTVR